MAADFFAGAFLAAAFLAGAFLAAAFFAGAFLALAFLAGALVAAGLASGRIAAISSTAYGDKQDDGSGTPWSSATVDLWIKPAVLPAVGTPAVIFDAQEWSGSYSKEMGLTMWLDSNGRVHGSAGFAGTANLSPTVEAISQSVASVGTWSHVTLTYDESGMLFLGFDGTDEVTKWTPAAPLRWFAQSVGVAYPGFAVGGTANGTPDKAFQGSIDEVAFVAGDESGTAMDIGDMRDLQVASGHAVGGIPARDPRELLGPNDSMRNRQQHLPQTCLVVHSMPASRNVFLWKAKVTHYLLSNCSARLLTISRFRNRLRSRTRRCLPKSSRL